MEADRGEVGGERAAAGDGFEAADVAAAADDVVVAGEADVADVARRALGAAVDAAAGDDAAADAGADLHVEQVLDVAPVRPVLAERHDVHVVVDEDGRVVVRGEPVRDREAVPAGHDRRRDGLAAREGDRAGDADADAADVGGGAGDLFEQDDEALVDVLEDDLGAVGDVHVERRLGQRGAREVGHDQPRVRGAEVGDQDDARALVEGQHGRGTPTGGGAAAGLVDELVREQRVEALRDRGTREAGAADEVRARHGFAVADQTEERTRAGHRSAPIVIQSAIDGSKAELAAGLVRIVAESSAGDPTNGPALPV